MTLPIGSEDWVSKFEKKFEESEEIGKVDDNKTNDNFKEAGEAGEVGEVGEIDEDVMFSGLLFSLSSFSYDTAVVFGSSC